MVKPETWLGELRAFGNQIALGEFVQIDLVTISRFKLLKQSFAFSLCPKKMIEIGLWSALDGERVRQSDEHVVHHFRGNAVGECFFDKRIKIRCESAVQLNFFRGA